jgi:hypothetical protein
MNLLSLKHLSREFVFSDLLPSNDSFVAIRCSWNVITQPLFSNGRLLWLHYSGFQAVFIEPLPSKELFRRSVNVINKSRHVPFADNS